MAKAHACAQADTIKKLSVDVAEIQGKIGNGLGARVKMIERMQWWQIGIMVSLIALLLGGLWFMTRSTMETNRLMLEKLQRHVETTGAMR